jgi:hypothetical protein
MGATSVTGVSGPGSVAGHQKGSEHMSLGVEKLIGPRVVAAGSATIGGGGTVNVDYPTLTGAASDYIVVASDTNAVVAAVNVTAFSTSQLTLKGTAAHVVNWAIIKTTLANV